MGPTGKARLRASNNLLAIVTSFAKNAQTIVWRTKIHQNDEHTVSYALKTVAIDALPFEFLAQSDSISLGRLTLNTFE